jgi:hypothetical protein
MVTARARALAMACVGGSGRPGRASAGDLLQARGRGTRAEVKGSFAIKFAGRACKRWGWGRGGRGFRRKYRVLKIKQEWTTSVAGGGELQRRKLNTVSPISQGTRRLATLARSALTSAAESRCPAVTSAAESRSAASPSAASAACATYSLALMTSPRRPSRERRWPSPPRWEPPP